TVLGIQKSDFSEKSDFFSEEDFFSEYLNLFTRLLSAGNTRLIFTSREPMPEPFDREKQTVSLHRLNKDSAVDLVTHVMAREGLELKEDDECNTAPEIESLVETVKYHARSLVLLAPHINKLGIRQTREKIAHIMAEIDRKFPNEREKSLFASVELSLQRLSAETREKIEVLGVFYGGAYINVLTMILNLNKQQSIAMAKQLIDAGIAEMMDFGYLRLHPALCPYINLQLDENIRSQMQKKWASGMILLLSFLRQQKYEDAYMANTLTLLDISNMLAMLAYIQKQGDPEATVKVAIFIEDLLQFLGKPQLLTTVSRIREQESEKIKKWGKTSFDAATLRVERLIENGNLSDALKESNKLKDKVLQQCDEHADMDMKYMIALVYWQLGVVLKLMGKYEESLPYLIESESRFNLLENEGNDEAITMVSKCIGEEGICYFYLGQLNKAEELFLKAIMRDEKYGALRDVGNGKLDLGTVYLYQNKYEKAMNYYKAARIIFEKIDDPDVAKVWYQIGMVNQHSGDYSAAEKAYQKTLAVMLQQQNITGEATTLNQLGTLYYEMGHFEESATFHKQSADIRLKIKDQAAEGQSRSNLAAQLIILKRFNEARDEIKRAIECKKPYGHAAQSWNTWNTLYDLEQAVGNTTAAAQAREKAMELFLAYRRDGGENHSNAGRLCFAFAQAVEAGQTDEIREHLKQLTHPSWKPLVSALQAILSGSRDPALASDPALHYELAVEVKLLLERLGKS
ncbi:MAG: tetratricopeptide repeat protein, partial [Desulfobacteraceae bacterium]|nr:tetratricopeptide repeat protein [Desulfobacteraceae bacterium]